MSVIKRFSLPFLAIFSTGISMAGEPGKLAEERWAGISGATVSSLTSHPNFPSNPSFTGTIAGVEPSSNTADNYGRRLRGWITAPQSGVYTFWVAGNDSGELWLSTGSNPAEKRKIAWFVTATNFRQWDLSASQKSASISLVQGEKYYLEVLHKEAGGGDHLSIAWQVQGGVREVVPAAVVDSFQVDPNDQDLDGLPDDWEQANGLLIDPVMGSQGVNGPVGDPDTDGFTNREEWLRQSAPAVHGNILGGLKREVWLDVAGSSVASLTSSPLLLQKPNFNGFMAGSVTIPNTGDNYGERLRGYVTIPAAGNYRFFVAGDDTCELWVSESGLPFAKEKAAQVAAWTAAEQWTKSTGQKSRIYSLVQGQVVYVEILHKESGGGDHAGLGWSINEGTPVKIPAAQLAAYAIPQNDRDDDSLDDAWELANGFDINDNGSLNPDQRPDADPDGDGFTNAFEASVGENPRIARGLAGYWDRSVWTGIYGSTVADLTGSLKYDGAPALRIWSLPWWRPRTLAE